MSIRKNHEELNNVCLTVLDELRKTFTMKFKQNRKFKLFNKRIFVYGYNFWINKPTINFTNIIHLLDIPINVKPNQHSLQTIVSSYCNEKLPQNHEFGWEILVSPVLFDTSSDKNFLHLPVSF